MFAILNVAYLRVRRRRSRSSARRGRRRRSRARGRIPEAKVYDPQGFYEKAGQPGPYFAGIWSGWQSGQPDGRPRRRRRRPTAVAATPKNVPNGGGSG